MVLVIGVLWGLNWPAVKFVLAEIDPWRLRAIGLVVAAALLAATARVISPRLAPRAGSLPQLIAAGLFSVFGFNLLTAFGQQITATSKAAIIAFTMPVWAALLSGLILGERIGGRAALGLIFGMTALALLAAQDWSGLIAAPAGPLIMLGAALSWALGSVLLKTAARELTAIARAAWMVGVSALAAIAGALLFAPGWEGGSLSTKWVAVFAFHVVGPMAVCYAVWTRLVERLPVSIAAIATLLIPVVGVGSSAALMGEPVGGLTIGALFAVLIAAALSLTAGARHDR